MSENALVAWGATPGDWTHFADTLGLKRDLLPVVSNPGAVISPRSRMKDKGKTPSRYNSDGQVAGIPKWTDNETSDGQLKKWMGERDYGICLQTRVVRALDIDIKDRERAREVRELIELGCGELPVRFRRDSGKCLLAFRLPAQGELDYTKRIIRTEHGIIEFLATGQQFIAAGTHPDGARYEWEGGLPGSIPELSPAEFEQCWLALERAFAIEPAITVRGGVMPAAPRREQDRFGDRMVDWLEENGHVKAFGSDGRVHIICPWQAEHSNPDEESESSTTYFPAGVGGFAQGHFRCLHAHCAGRKDQDFIDAYGFSISDEFDIVAPAPDDPPPWPTLVRDRNGRIQATAANVRKMLERPDIVGVRLGYDEFLGQLLIALDIEQWDARPIQDVDYYTIRERLEEHGMKGPGKELVRDACHKVGWDNKSDSARSWVESLQWDGVERVERFFTDYVGCRGDSEYLAAVGRYWWTALAGRALVPGSQADMVPVLIGGQGVGKTQTVKAMAPRREQFASINLERSDDDLARIMRGVLVGELGELRGLHTKDAETIKDRIVRTEEKWTPKYMENATIYKRRVMFMGTSNEDDFLADSTGNRRWLPLTVEGFPSDIAPGKRYVRLDDIKQDMEQLWAEGAARFMAGGIEWEDAERLAPTVHKDHMIEDPWRDAIANWLKGDEDDFGEGARWATPFRVTEVLAGAMQIPAERQNRVSVHRAVAVLRTLGFERKQMRGRHGNNKYWCATSKWKALVS